MGSTRILISERNSNMREFLRREFARQGFEVLAAGDGRELWDGLGGDPLGLVVLDLELPNTERISAWEMIGRRAPGVPLILHTFFPDEVDPAQALRAAAVVDKNGNFNGLVETVAKTVRGQAGEK